MPEIVSSATELLFSHNIQKVHLNFKTIKNTTSISFMYIWNIWNIAYISEFFGHLKNVGFIWNKEENNVSGEYLWPPTVFSLVCHFEVLWISSFYLKADRPESSYWFALSISLQYFQLFWVLWYTFYQVWICSNDCSCFIYNNTSFIRKKIKIKIFLSLYRITLILKVIFWGVMFINKLFIHTWGIFANTFYVFFKVLYQLFY